MRVSEAKENIEKQQTPSENHEPNSDTASAADEAIDVGLSILQGPSRGVPAKLLKMGCQDRAGIACPRDN